MSVDSIWYIHPTESARVFVFLQNGLNEKERWNKERMTTSTNTLFRIAWNIQRGPLRPWGHDSMR